MAEAKDSKSKKSDEKEPEVRLSGTGRPLGPHEGDPKAAAEAATNASVPAGAVEPDEAEPGQPIVDPSPADSPENQTEVDEDADKDADKK